VKGFEGRTALVTGAGGGIGAAIVRALVQEGARTVLCGRSVASLEAVRVPLAPSAADRTWVLPLDVRDARAVEDAFDRIAEIFGTTPDTLAVCHGVNTIRPLEQLDDTLWTEVIATNLTGTFHCLRAAMRRMRPIGHGRIVVISSVSGRPGFEKFPGFAAYCASKYALTGLVEVAAAELAGTDVGLAMICPGGVDTEMFRRTLPGRRASLTPEDVARAAIELLDPAVPASRGAIVDLV
jgi:NAD(P)-dependent dehydrogenase (short-subunit alcohol dehydrogenase family)